MGSDFRFQSLDNQFILQFSTEHQHVPQRTSIREKNGKLTKTKDKNEKVDEPTWRDILEALEMMALPLSSPCGSPTSWNLDEHERFIQGLRMYRDEPFIEVKNYGIRCWKSKKCQQCVASPQSQCAHNEVKVEPEQSPPPHESAGETFVKRHRVRKWFRAAFKWCVEVLSFRCIRQNEQFALGAVGHYPVQRGRFVFSTTERDNSIAFGVPIPTRGPVLQSTGTPTSYVRATRPHHEPRHRLAPRKRSGGNKFDGRSTNFSNVIVDSLSEDSLSDGGDDNDDWNMISARRAASEIEWYDTTRESSLSSASTTIKPVRKRGAWSADEHERYCEGVKLFRYGSWKRIADHVGTRTVRQVTSHAQSVRMKKKRVEEREKRRTTQPTALRNSAKSHGSTQQNAITITSQMQTPEELLLASMLTPLPMHANVRHTKNVAAITSNYSDVASMNIDPNQHDITGISNYAVDQTFPSEHGAQNAAEDIAEMGTTKKGEADFHRVLQADKRLLYSDLMLNSDVPLCSPPPGILLSDDEFADLLDITSTQSQTPVATYFKTCTLGSTGTLCHFECAALADTLLSFQVSMSRQSSTSSTSTWTRGSYDTFTNNAAIVEPRRIVLTTLKVKVMIAEPGSSIPSISGDATKMKQHRVRKWIKSTFKWCVKALTLSCLRKKHTYTEPYRAPILGSKPTVATNQRGNSSSIEFVAIQSRRPRSSQNISQIVPEDNDFNVPTRGMLMKSGIWSRDEHERYCEALEIFRYGSWKQIAEYVGSRTERQVLSHAQSIRARKKKDEERKQTETTSKFGDVEQEIDAVSITPSLLKTQQFTPEELLAASMTDPEPKILPLMKQDFDAMYTDDETVTPPNLPPWDLNLDLELSFCEIEAEAPMDTNTMEDTQQSTKRLKLNPDSDANFDVRLTSSSLEILLDGVLSDEDLLLEIPSAEPDVELLCEH